MNEEIQKAIEESLPAQTTYNSDGTSHTENVKDGHTEVTTKTQGKS